MNAGATGLARLPLLLIEDERSVMEFIRTALEYAKSGDIALVIAFGAGLAYAAQVVKVP